MKLLLPNQSRHCSQRSYAFTLLEVIIASAIFFIVAFAVLELVATGLVAARKLQLRHPDAGVLASQLIMTNQLVEGSESGDFEAEYPGLYDGYAYQIDTLEVWSNGLFQVDFTIYNDRQRGQSETHMRILCFRPGSPPGSATKGR